MRKLSAREVDAIEKRLRAGAVTNEDIERLVYTVRSLLEEKPKKGMKGNPQEPTAEPSESPGIVVEVFTDGACSGNPGPGGWGAIVKFNGTVKELSGGEPHTTNNRMELIAAIEALRYLPDGSTVMLTTDSQYVKNGIISWIITWKRNGWKNSAKEPVKNADLWRMLDGLNQRHNVKWCWVRGHNGHPENERCDQLAREAIGKLQ